MNIVMHKYTSKDLYIIRIMRKYKKNVEQNKGIDVDVERK